MQTAGSVTAVGNCVAQPAECVIPMPDCVMQPGTAVTQTGSVVIREPSVASHEAGSCLVAAAAHPSPAMAPLGLVSLERASHLPVPLLWMEVTPSGFSSSTVCYREPQSGV
jgi:hypothetical protein